MHRNSQNTWYHSCEIDRCFPMPLHYQVVSWMHSKEIGLWLFCCRCHFFWWLRMDLSSNWIATCLAHLRQQRPNGEKVKSDSGIGSWTGKSTKSAENVLICVSMVCRCRLTRESDTVNNSPFRFKEEKQSMVRKRLLQRCLNTKGVPGDISNVFKFMKSMGGNSIAHDAHVLK